LSDSRDGLQGAGPDNSTSTDEDAARTPAPEYERPAPVRPDPVDVGPADLYCGTCGAGNASGRSFCRRCGSPLADAVAAQRLRWWQRLWRRIRRKDRSYAAGERPDSWNLVGRDGRTRSRFGWLRRIRIPTRLTLGRLALPLALLSLVGFGIAPIRAAVTAKGFELYHDIRRVVAPRFVPVSASGAAASTSQQGHEPAAAIDQNVLTWWSEGRDGRGRGETLTVRFDRPVDVDMVSVTNGAADEKYPFQPRVRGLRITLRGPDGVVAERRVLLADKRARQDVEVSGDGVTRVSLRILSTYAGQRGTAASVAEVAVHSKQ
jgi:hypothetical protein